MNIKEKEDIAELRTHVMYIKDSIEKLNKKMDSIPCGLHATKLQELTDVVSAHDSQHKRDSAIIATGITIAVSIIIFIAEHIFG